MDQKNIVRDIIVGLTMTLVSLTVIVLIPRQIQLATTFGEDIGVNSRTFPYFTTGIIGIAAVLHLIVSIVKFIKLKSTAAKGVDREPNGNLYGEVLSIIMFILFAIYAVLFQKLGYILSSIVVPAYYPCSFEE